jgi:hypothetical protein
MSTQPEAILEAELVARLRSMSDGCVALDAKVAAVAQSVAACQKWQKGRPRS